MQEAGQTALEQKENDPPLFDESRVRFFSVFSLFTNHAPLIEAKNYCRLEERDLPHPSLSRPSRLQGRPPNFPRCKHFFGPEVPQINVSPTQKEISGTMKCEELLLNSISYFNKLLREGGHGKQLKDNDKLYTLHIAKKNGKPKDDLPRMTFLNFM